MSEEKLFFEPPFDKYKYLEMVKKIKEQGDTGTVGDFTDWLAGYVTRLSNDTVRKTDFLKRYKKYRMPLAGISSTNLLLLSDELYYSEDESLAAMEDIMLFLGLVMYMSMEDESWLTPGLTEGMTGLKEKLVYVAVKVLDRHFGEGLDLTQQDRGVADGTEKDETEQG